MFAYAILTETLEYKILGRVWEVLRSGGQLTSCCFCNSNEYQEHNYAFRK